LLKDAVLEAGEDSEDCFACAFSGDRFKRCHAAQRRVTLRASIYHTAAFRKR